MVKIAADTVEDFLAKGAKKFGKGRMGKTVLKPDWTYGSFADGVVTKLTFTFKSEADFAEVGGGKPDDENKKAMKLVALLAKEHEDNFEMYCQDAIRSWNPKDQAEAVMSRTFASKPEAVKAMEAKFADLKKVLLDACLKLHKKEGVIGVELQKDGRYDVFTKPEGASGCR